jgi:hypothetical protein
MTVFRGSGRGIAAKVALPTQQVRYPQIFLGAALGLSLALYAQAQTRDSGTAAFGQSVNLASPATSPLPRLVVDCVSVEPAKMQARPVSTSLDRPTCSSLSAPASAQSNRDLLKVARADVAVSLGLTGDEQGFGLMRALASFSHFLDAGPLGGWQFGAEAQLSRPPDLESAYLVDERVRLSLTPPQLAGWSLRFDAGAASQGGFDPSSATQRDLSLSGDLSHGFVVSSLGQEHRLHVRLSENRTQDRVWGTDQQTTRASLGYTHTIVLGSIGTDLAVIRTQPLTAPASTSTRVEVKFARPF